MPAKNPRVFRLVAPENFFEGDAEFLGLYVELQPCGAFGRHVYTQIDGKSKIFYSDSKRQWIVGTDPVKDEGWLFADSDALSPDTVNGWSIWDIDQDKWETEENVKIVRAGERRGETGVPHRYKIFSGRTSPSIDTQISTSFLDKIDAFSTSSSSQADTAPMQEQPRMKEEDKNVENVRSRSKSEHKTVLSPTRVPSLTVRIPQHESPKEPEYQTPSEIKGESKSHPASPPIRPIQIPPPMSMNPVFPKSNAVHKPKAKTPKKCNMKPQAKHAKRQPNTSPPSAANLASPRVTKQQTKSKAVTKSLDSKKRSSKKSEDSSPSGRKKSLRKRRRSVSPNLKKSRRRLVTQCSNCMVRRHDNFIACRKCEATLCTKCYAHHYCGRESCDVRADPKSTARRVYNEL